MALESQQHIVLELFVSRLEDQLGASYYAREAKNVTTWLEVTLMTPSIPKWLLSSTTNKLFLVPLVTLVTPCRMFGGCWTIDPATRGTKWSLSLTKKQSLPPSYSSGEFRGICVVEVAYPPSQWKAIHDLVGPRVIRRAILGLVFPWTPGTWPKLKWRLSKADRADWFLSLRWSTVPSIYDRGGKAKKEMCVIRPN